MTQEYCSWCGIVVDPEDEHPLCLECEEEINSQIQLMEELDEAYHS